jgi:cytochrome c-type biogenesis protein CcmH
VLSGIALLLIPATWAAISSAATPRTNLPDVEDEVMCTICGTLLEESDSPQADSERELIRKLIADGETKNQIKDALVAQYGPNVLATPSGHGFDLAAWIVPGLVIGLGSRGWLSAPTGCRGVRVPPHRLPWIRQMPRGSTRT